MESKKRTYLTKADALSFARYITSDERRFEHQKEAAKKAKAGILLFTPWTMTLRNINNQDFEKWKIWRAAGNDKF